MNITTREHHKYSLLLYLLIANGFTWMGWIPGLVIGAREGYIMPNFTSYAELIKIGFVNPQQMFLGIAFQLGVYGPLIGSLVATWVDSRRDGLVDLWHRITKWNIRGHWYLIVFVLILVMSGLPVAIFELAGGFTPSSVTIAYVLFVFAAQLLTSDLGEEPGWRGFLLPCLQARFEGEKYI